MNLHRLLVIHLGVAGMFLGLGACGGGGGTAGVGGQGGSPETGPKVEELPAKLAESYCVSLKSCLGLSYDLFLNGEDCVKRLTSTLEEGDFHEIPALVSMGTLSYDGSKVAACLDAVKSAGCDLITERIPAACQAVFNGTGKEGDPCTVAMQCGGDFYCKAGNACPGACAPRAKAGVACTGDDGCESGLLCRNQLCAAPLGAGASCGDGGPGCSPGLLCSGKSGGMNNGICKPVSEAFQATLGASCNIVANEFCSPAYSCSLDMVSAGGATFKCIDALPSGADCKASVPDACPDGEYCPVDFQAQPPKLQGKCTKVPKAGEACGKGLTGDICEPYAVCASAGCKARQSIGGSCGAAIECNSGLCKGGSCAVKLACEPPGMP